MVSENGHLGILTQESLRTTDLDNCYSEISTIGLCYQKGNRSKVL